MTDTYLLKSLLSHYLRTGFEGAGGRWSADNEREVEQMVLEIKALVRSVVAEETSKP